MSKKVKTSSGKQIRLPKDFIWKLMMNVSKDLESITSIGTELKTFNQIVRKRDRDLYVTTCKKRWALNKLEDKFVSACRPELGETYVSIIKHLRAIRCLTMFEKFQFPSDEEKRIKVAYEAFKKYEKLCKRTNEDKIFHQFVSDEDFSSMSSIDAIYTTRVMRHMEAFILQVLGPELDFRIMSNSFRHGPGATVDKRGNNSTLIGKLPPPYGCSAGASQHFIDNCVDDEIHQRAIRDYWFKCIQHQELDGYLHPNFLLKEENRSSITFVPKDAEKDRTINIEPTANIYLQLGVDGYIRKRLKNLFSIDINTQEKNQRLAKIGSETDKLVTLDISGASDCVSLALLNLFPEKWAKFLLELRMHSGIFSHNNELIQFEKLSTMGNGFTFAIETLIFSAILYGVAKEKGLKWKDIIDDSAIYGDDIIFPSKLYSDYSFMLHRLGFRENEQKTFSRGPIRESCGHDYYHGVRIDRPTIKTVPTTIPDFYVLHNTFVVLQKEYGFSFKNTCDFILTYTSEKSFGPYNPENMCAYLFGRREQYMHTIVFNLDYQAFFYKIKSYAITHPFIFKRSRKTKLFEEKTLDDVTFLFKKKSESSIFEYLESSGLDSFLPLLFYSKSIEEQQVCDFPPDRRAQPIWEDSTEETVRSLFFLKKLRSIRRTITMVPIYGISE